MQFIADRLKPIKGLREPLFFMDDTALVGTPEALANATHVMANCIAETGLRLKWSKCHLHALPLTISRCKPLPFPKGIQLHEDFNMEYLKAPIGDDKFVRHWLHKKLIKLTKIVSLLSAMPHKHEAATLLKSTAAVCRVVYLMRILPPAQISSFISQYDTTLRQGFEQILGIPMDDIRWEIAKLPPKYGGMGWKTGSHTYGAHYIASLAKTSDRVCSISPSHDTFSIAQRDASNWLRSIAPTTITIQNMIEKIRNPRQEQHEPNLSRITLSIAQQCDEWHWKTLLPQLNDEELSHTLAHSGSNNWWTTCAPLEWRKWNMKPREWTAATRRRLHLDVIPSEQQCSYCHWQRCDTKGNHAVMCGSGPSRTWRHNSLRNLLAKAIEGVGFKIGYEHNGGLHDGRKPGDIIVYNWNGDKHLLVDVGITNSLAAHNRSALLKMGPGGGAAATEQVKRGKYKDIDSSEYTYLPFILETCGAFGEPALQLCRKLRKIWLTKCCSGNDSPNFRPLHRSNQQHENIDPLLVSISVLLQKHNGQMILERAPLSPQLLESDIARSHARTDTHRKWATEELNAFDRGSHVTVRRFSSLKKETDVPTGTQENENIKTSQSWPSQTHLGPKPKNQSKTCNILKTPKPTQISQPTKPSQCARYSPDTKACRSTIQVVRTKQSTIKQPTKHQLIPYTTTSSTTTSTSRSGSQQHYTNIYGKTSPPHCAMYHEETIPHLQHTICWNGTDHFQNPKEPSFTPTHDHSSPLKLHQSSHNSNYLTTRKDQPCDSPTKAIFNKNIYGLTRVITNVENVTLPHGNTHHDTPHINDPKTLSTPPEEEDHLYGIDNRSYNNGAHSNRNKQVLFLQSNTNPDLIMDFELPPSSPTMDLD